jgi:hypothetical protein
MAAPQPSWKQEAKPATEPAAEKPASIDPNAAGTGEKSES